MPGYLIEIPEKERQFLYGLSKEYTEESFWSHIRRGGLVRPTDTDAYHFLPETLENTYGAYKNVTKRNKHFHNELKFSFYMHSFLKSPQPFYWTWACGFSTFYKEAPVLFPFFSTSRMVMMSSDYGAQHKREHIKETLKPILAEKNLIIRFFRKKKSLTHDILMELDFVSHKWEIRGDMILSSYIIAKSTSELSILSEREFAIDEFSVSKNWVKANNSGVPGGYNFFPKDLI